MSFDVGMLLAALPALWLLLALLLRAAYPAIAQQLVRLEPHCRALALRQLSLAPLLIALTTAALLYLPGSPLQPAHCHGLHCTPHSPHAIAGWWLLIPLALFALPAVVRSLRTLIESRELQRQWLLLSEPRGGYQLIDNDRPLACTIGLWRPQIFLSRGLLQQLPAGDIDIIVAHERSHRLRRDSFWLWIARIGTLRLCAELCSDLELAQEEIGDRAAAAINGELAVAETLLRCARLMEQPHRLACAFFRDSLGQRVRALLTPTDEPLPRSAAIWLPSVVPLIATAAVVPLHLLLELMH